MERYDVRFLKDVLEDLEEIILYIANGNKPAALKMHNLLFEKANDLARFPKRGRLVPDKKMAEIGFRMLIIEKYIVFYKINDKVVHIHRALHGSRNCPVLIGRIEDKLY